MVTARTFAGEYPAPIETLERHFLEGGVSLVQAVFENTFFVAPAHVRERTPYYPDRARKSRTHYPGLDAGAAAEWNGKPVRLDFNARAQMAWERYTGRPIERRSGYGVRHIWGHPWDPDAYTAGWNLAYMPFWAGMLTEDQHPHEVVRTAIKQAGWELFFQDNAVCDPPDFVSDPGHDLDELLGDQALLVIERSGATHASARAAAWPEGSPEAAVIEHRRALGASWSNLRKGVRSVLGLEHEEFGTVNVRNRSRSDVRRIARETGLALDQLLVLFDRLGGAVEDEPS